MRRLDKIKDNTQYLSWEQEKKANNLRELLEHYLSKVEKSVKYKLPDFSPFIVEYHDEMDHQVREDHVQVSIKDDEGVIILAQYIFNHDPFPRRPEVRNARIEKCYFCESYDWWPAFTERLEEVFAPLIEAKRKNDLARLEIQRKTSMRYSNEKRAEEEAEKKRLAAALSKVGKGTTFKVGQRVRLVGTHYAFIGKTGTIEPCSPDLLAGEDEYAVVLDNRGGVVMVRENQMEIIDDQDQSNS